MKPYMGFTEDEMLFIFELAYSACRDAELLDTLTENMDITDGQMIEMRDKLIGVMQ